MPAANLSLRADLTDRYFAIQSKVLTDIGVTSHMSKTKLMAVGVSVLTLASGCASLGVKAYDRDLLARDEMRLGANPVDAAIDEHMYFSKEASSGGRSYAGGGCG